MEEIKRLKDSMKKFDHDIRNMYTLVKNIEINLANKDDEFESLKGHEDDDVDNDALK